MGRLRTALSLGAIAAVVMMAIPVSVMPVEESALEETALEEASATGSTPATTHQSPAPSFAASGLYRGRKQQDNGQNC